MVITLHCITSKKKRKRKLRSLGPLRKNIEPTLRFLLHDARSPAASRQSTQLRSEPSTATCRMASVETAAEHERILREIESTDTNCIGPTLR